MECPRAEYFSCSYFKVLESIAKQVHDYFANDYVPRSDYLVEDIRNYCLQLPRTFPELDPSCTDTSRTDTSRPDLSLPDPTCTCPEGPCLDYRDFMDFLFYLAAKTIVLIASGIRTQFKTFGYLKKEYIRLYHWFSRADNSASNLFGYELDGITKMANMIERFHDEGGPSSGLSALPPKPHVPKLPYESLIHHLYPLMAGSNDRFHVGMFREGQRPQDSSSRRHMYLPPNASIRWKYIYSASIECQTTRQRQQKLHTRAMEELEYTPPCPGLLPNGGIRYQEGLESFNNTIRHHVYENTVAL